MRKLKTKFLISVMCISLIVPQVVTEAAATADFTEPVSENELNETHDDLDESDNIDNSVESDNLNNLNNADDKKTNQKDSDYADDEKDDINDDKKKDNLDPIENPDDEALDPTENPDGEDFDGEDPDELGDDFPYDLDALGDLSEEELAMLALQMFGGIMPLDDDPGYDPSIEPESGPHGSGSYQLNEVPDDYRFYTEYYVGAASGKKDNTAGITRRTTIRVYAKAGELILFGSSVSDSEIDKDNNWTGKVTGQDIVITTPSGEKVPEDVLKPGEKDKDGKVHEKGYGYIANPTQEKYGPMVNHADANDPEKKYYAPIAYEATESGVYTFEFHSKTGYNDGTVATPILAGKSGWNQNKTTVAAWDVTVLGEKDGKWKVKEGRAWADYLALSTGAAGTTQSDLNVHVLTHDGYVYKVDFSKAVPFGFIFFANNTGFMTSVSDDNGNVTKSPIYHAFYDSSNDLDNMTSGENIILHKPEEADTSTEETYKIFFNPPSADLKGVIDQKGNQIKTEPDENVTLDDLKFVGTGDNVTQSGHGGHFTFTSSGEAVVTITLDLRKAIYDSEKTMDEYEGSGIVEITAPVHEGSNSIYWNGQDTEGIVIPAGIYGNQNVLLATEIKRGELHFPVIDMEGLYGGLCVQRLNKSESETDENLNATAYNLYYNNNPLAYGTIEGKDFPRTLVSGFNALSDGTKSYNISSSLGGINYFKNGQLSISTLVKDDKEYLAQKFFNTSYDHLSPTQKSIIDAEFGKEMDTYHHEPMDSRNNTMIFSNSGDSGGGNRAGIDAWTYYTQGVSPKTISFAILDSLNKGLVRGQIFYDANKNSKYDTGEGAIDYPLANMRVRLLDKNGDPLVHEELMPCFDDAGHFIYNTDGTVKHELRKLTYETVTDAAGNYRFTGVPYSSDSADITEYYVQVMLSDTQSEVLRYTCTTSEEVKNKLYMLGENDTHIPFHTNTIDAGAYGADGNKLVEADRTSKIYGYKYGRDEDSYEVIYDKGNVKNTQKVTFSLNEADMKYENGIRVEDFKKIGYCTTVPSTNQKDYKLVKDWGTDTHRINDGVTVELWVWNDTEVKEENERALSRRTGALMDTQVLNADNDWTYTWKNLDDRLQYYVLEYYTKKKADGEIIYNDKGEPRLVLIGGTMPIFSTVSDDKIIYGFKVDLGDYPETIPDPDDSTKLRIPIQKFSAGGTHYNSITTQEKIEMVDNNARQYDVRYTLSRENDDKINVITMTNSQSYDDRTYYVWLNHERELPDMIAQTFVDDQTGHRDSHSITLKPDVLVDQESGEYSVKGLSVSSVDAAGSTNAEGNATNAFRIKADSKNVLFTATNQGNYKTGTGTRTYRVKYVVTNDTNQNPVAIKVNDENKLVLASDGTTKVEDNSQYKVYTWLMTIHVYDVQPDGVFEYNPKGGSVNLQAALPKDAKLTWTLTHDKDDENAVSYTSDDPRKEGILLNDTLRLPLYKSAVEPDMGSCADFVGIAYAGEKPVANPALLAFADTYQSRYGNGNGGDSSDELEDGIAKAYGSGGTLVTTLNPLRSTKINRTQDHANYAAVSFIPKAQANWKAIDGKEDVFYYKIVILAEDSTYQFHRYNDIDATEGVVMYTYFTMKAKMDPNDPDLRPEDNPDGGSSNHSDDSSSGTTVKKGENTLAKQTDETQEKVSKSPKTSDDNHWMLWNIITLLSACVFVVTLIQNLKSMEDEKVKKKARRREK